MVISGKQLFTVDKQEVFYISSSKSLQCDRLRIHRNFMISLVISSVCILEVNMKKKIMVMSCDAVTLYFGNEHEKKWPNMNGLPVKRHS